MDASMLRRVVVALAVAQLVAPVLLFPGNFNDQTAMPPLAAVPNPATPAGYAFAIWGVLYVLAVVYAVYQALPLNAHDALLARIGWFTAAGYALCIAWLCAARFGPSGATVPIIVGMLGCLGAAFLIVMDRQKTLGTLRQIVVAAPLALYVGWLTAATFLNAANVLPGYGFDRFGLSPQAFGVLVIAAAGVLGAALTVRTAAYPPYVAAVLWALVSIVVSNGSPAGGSPVFIAATVATLVLIGVACRFWLSAWRSPWPAGRAPAALFISGCLLMAGSFLQLAGKALPYPDPTPELLAKQATELNELSRLFGLGVLVATFGGAWLLWRRWAKRPDQETSNIQASKKDN